VLYDGLPYFKHYCRGAVVFFYIFLKQHYPMMVGNPIVNKRSGLFFGKKQVSMSPLSGESDTTMSPLSGESDTTMSPLSPNVVTYFKGENP
jgi:hypothetical protein